MCETGGGMINFESRILYGTRSWSTQQGSHPMLTRWDVLWFKAPMLTNLCHIYLHSLVSIIRGFPSETCVPSGFPINCAYLLVCKWFLEHQLQVWPIRVDLKSWSLARKGRRRQVGVLFHDVNYHSGNRFGVKARCCVGKQVFREHLYGYNNVFIATSRRLLWNQVNLHGVFGSCDMFNVFNLVFKLYAFVSVVGFWFPDTFFTWHNPLFYQLRFDKVVVFLSARNFSFGESGCFSTSPWMLRSTSFTSCFGMTIWYYLTVSLSA